MYFFFSVSIASEEIFSPLSRTLRDRCGLIFKSHTRLFFQIYRKRTSIYDNMSHVECVWGEGGRGRAEEGELDPKIEHFLSHVVPKGGGFLTRFCVRWDSLWFLSADCRAPVWGPLWGSIRLPIGVPQRGTFGNPIFQNPILENPIIQASFFLVVEKQEIKIIKRHLSGRHKLFCRVSCGNLIKQPWSRQVIRKDFL